MSKGKTRDKDSTFAQFTWSEYMPKHYKPFENYGFHIIEGNQGKATKWNRLGNA